MDHLDRIAKNSNEACRIAALRQPYVFWQDDLISIQTELPKVPRLTWRKEIEHACEAWGEEITGRLTIPELELAPYIACFHAEGRSTIGFVVSPGKQTTTYDVRVYRKWEV